MAVEQRGVARRKVDDARCRRRAGIDDAEALEAQAEVEACNPEAIRLDVAEGRRRYMAKVVMGDVDVD